jgi:hypothetical protein
MATPEAPIPFALALARGRRIRELPSSERPRERLQLRGAAGLTAAELIGLLWGSGTAGRSAVDVAADAIARFDGLSGLARASGPELEAVPGIGAARAAQLQAAFCAVPLLRTVPCATGLVVVGAGIEDAARVAERIELPLLAAIPGDPFLAEDTFAARAPTLRAIDDLLRALA